MFVNKKKLVENIMGLVNNSSDYGSGESLSQSTMTWADFNKWPSALQMQQSATTFNKENSRQKTSSLVDLAMGRCTIDDVMKEFRMNGSDSPYNPDDNKMWGRQTGEFVGMGPSSAYLRQKSWPEPDRSPAARLPRPASEWIPSPNAMEFIPALSAEAPEPMKSSASSYSDVITPEQLRVLNSLPDTALYSLLRNLEQERGERRVKECRFCKNNGERESYYRSHVLKDKAGRVSCPVLRAFVCKRCGASGDRAHTIKYCPLSTDDERIKSAAMMRSVRLASGRRRMSQAIPNTNDFMLFGAPTSSIIEDKNIYQTYVDQAPLDPLWAALEKKLMV